MSNVSRVAMERGWKKIGETEKKSFKKKALHIAWEMSPGVELSYLSDSKERTAYMLITSRSTSDLDSYVAQLVDADLDFITPDELLERVASENSPKGKGLALIRSGIGAPENPTQPYVRAFFGAMRDPSPTVRLSGITAMGYAEWPEFLELLDAVALEDDDKEVKAHARSMASAFRKVARGEE
ncbi:HEAT repeat domain-containing protein [Streptomyces chartreusis]|uniref:HEAT repeat domain-containing protein n=1 Tax=Streptomyces chartreusis TaxID=1969 RepID=A0A7H8TIL5_STRCX|nr:HEAT repeat domain-containing protein [Streptomyces chartreusis]QKZ23381.1 HEAT repeat domain-containing protein [Streptomyces chartreusis]